MNLFQIWRLSIKRLSQKPITYLFAFVVLFVISGIISLYPAPTFIKTGFHKFFTYTADPFFAIAAGVFGLIIWSNQNRRKFIEELPKRMTVHFKWNDKIIASCYESALAHEGDIRQWAQQIGRQMLGENFKMYPYFNIDTPIVAKSETEMSQGKYSWMKEKPLPIRLYNVTVFLNADSPQNILEKGKKYYRTQTLIWSENNPNSPENEVFIHKKGFLRKEYTLTQIHNSNDFGPLEIIPSNYDQLIEEKIFEIQGLNEKIKKLSNETDQIAIDYLKEQKSIANKNLQELLDRRSIMNN
ncbi:MAG: hypothetical protein ACEPOZ_20085 [Marinifilaceae bacterium]